MSEVERPNFLLIVGEDTGRLLGCYGDAYADTPHLDRLAAEGCRYDRAFSVAPVCAPSRSALVSGQYPMKIGTHHMRSTLVEAPRMFTQELREAGYYVSWPTKLDFNFEPQEGWRDDDEPWVERLREGRMPRRPWMAYVNLGVTHESGMWPDKENPSPQTHDPSRAPVPSYLPDTPEVREDVARHYNNMTAMDVEVGEILAALEASGEADRTVVIFLADHGRGLPREKRWCYAAGIHMPLIVRWPGAIEAGSVCGDLVSWVDVAPTLLLLAGVEAPKEYDGVPFLGERARKREHAFAGRDRMDENFDRVRSVTSERFHYIRNFYPELPWAPRHRYLEKLPTMQVLRRLRREGKLEGAAAAFMAESKPAEELYDLERDPECVRNLADDEAYREVKDTLSRKLEAWMEEIGDLGAVSERKLIERGLVKNRLDGEYRLRIEALPEEDRIGPATSLLEMEDVEARYRG